MLLSRSAWQLLWIGRFLERAEGTARAVWSMHMMDSNPRAKGLSTWGRLLEAFGQDEAYAQAGSDAGDNRAMMRFMVASRDNPNSLHGLCRQMRDNMRSARGYLPDELWRYATELEGLADVAGRVGGGGRYEALDGFIRLCRGSAGVAMTAMRRDAPFSFWQLGRRLECVDVTSRMLLWALSEASEEVESEDESDNPSDDLRWVFLLKSMGLGGAYHSGTHSAVSGPRVVDFLVSDQRLPHSVRFCLSDARVQLDWLPANERPLQALSRASQIAGKISGGKPDCARRLERLLESLGRTFDAVGAGYFPRFR